MVNNKTIKGSPTPHALHAPWQWRAGKALSWQVLGLLLIWVYISALHLHNDGLWFEGDASRHAANGIFWWDFLSHFSFHPVQFALSYYARYPMIQPTAYPPLFYLLEGPAFKLFGISPLVGKGLVLGFALLGGGYTIAWLRRWVAEEAGWGGILLLLQPGVILWSHTIMLNIPAMTMSLMTLYYTRRWLEAPASRYLYAATVLALCVPLIYVPAGVTLGVILAWIFVERRWGVFQQRRVVILAAILMLALGPWLVLAMYWAPAHAAMVFPNRAGLADLSHWFYYAAQLPVLFRLGLLLTALLGILVGVWQRQWRREICIVLTWSMVCYLGLSYVMSREARYALLLGPPVVIFGVSTLFYAQQWIRQRLKRQQSWVFGTALATMVLLHLGSAHQVHVPAVKGMRAVVAFLNQHAPHGYIFYDGYYDGLFSFYIRAHDPQFERGVIVGRKLLYASAIFTDWRLTELVSSPAEVVAAFRQHCGCQWLVIARSKQPLNIAAVHHLYTALEGPEFQLMQSFPVQSPLVAQVDVYRFLLPAAEPAERDFPFPYIAPGAVLHIKPLCKGFKSCALRDEYPRGQSGLKAG